MKTSPRGREPAWKRFIMPTQSFRFISLFSGSQFSQLVLLTLHRGLRDTISAAVIRMKPTRGLLHSCSIYHLVEETTPSQCTSSCVNTPKKHTTLFLYSTPTFISSASIYKIPNSTKTTTADFTKWLFLNPINMHR